MAVPSAGAVPATDPGPQGGAAIAPAGRPARRWRRAAQAAVAGIVVAAVVVVVPVVAFGPPSWVPEALVPAFLDRSAGPTVALVPAPGPAIEGPPASASEAPIDLPDPGVTLLARPAGGDPWAEVAYATVTAEAPVTADGSPPAGEGIAPVTVGARGGVMGTDEHSGHRWVSVPTPAGHLTVWSGRGTSAHDLLALSAGLDPTASPPSPELAGGWQVVTTSTEALGGATLRQIGHQLVEPDGFLQVSTRTGVGADALWLVGSSTVADRLEVRGRPGLITGLDSGTAVTLTWAEEPGVVVQLTLVAEDDDLLSHALRLAADLHPVDQGAWEDLAAEAHRWSQATGPDPEAAPAPPVVVLAGALADGRSFRIEERHDTALCVVVDGPHPFDRCDERRGRTRDGSVAALPRLVDPGDLAVEDRSPLLVYGYLPERRLRGDWGRVQDALGAAVPVGQAVTVDVADTRGRSHGTAAIVGGTWALHIPDVTLGLVVTYTFPDGTTLEVEPDPGSDADGDPS